MRKKLILPALSLILSTASLFACGETIPSTSVQESQTPSVEDSSPIFSGVVHVHKYDGYQIDGDVHYQKCTYMNCTYETEHTKHVYDQEVYTPAAFKSEATCEQAAQFYKSCICGVISTTETFSYGTKLDHSSAGEFKTDATHHWKECDCGEVHGKVEHELLDIVDVADCVTDGGKYQLCNECGWTTPVEQRENYVPAFGHQLSDQMTLASFPSNSSEGILSFACLREGCKSGLRVGLPLATEDNYTFVKNGDNFTATLKEEAITTLAAKYTEIEDLATRLTGHAFETTAAKVGYPYTFKINQKQVLPNVPAEQDTNNNHLSVILALKAGDVLEVYNNGSIVSFVPTEWGTIASGTQYTATSSAVMKLHISKDGGLYGETLNVLPFDSYTIKVNGVEKLDAAVEATGTDFARFELELTEGDVVTFYGDGNALSGGVVANAEEGYKAFSTGTHTFYVNNLNQIYVTAPELSEVIEITYYYYNSLGWESVNCYSWYNMGATTGNLASGWPGTEMEPVADKEGWYTLTVDLSAAATQVNVIFNADGTDANKTADITVLTNIEEVAEGYYFFGKSTTVYTSFEEVEEAVNNYVPPKVGVWGVVGSGFTSSDWGTDVWMEETTAGVYEATISSTKSIEFKIRKNADWAENYGGTFNNGKVEGTQDGSNIALPAGTYKITFDETTHLITVTPVTNQDPDPNPGTSDSSSDNPSVDPSVDPSDDPSVDPTPDPAEGYVVYYYNSKGWTTVNSYIWDASDTTHNGSWPGSPMTAVEGKIGWYSVTIEAESLTGYNIIFNNGSSQTSDIALDASKLYFFGTTGVGYASFEEVESALSDAPAANVVTISLNMNPFSDGAKVYAWIWGGGTNGEWVECSAGENDSVTFETEYSITGCKIVRFANTVTTPSWDATKWNESGDITVSNNSGSGTL